MRSANERRQWEKTLQCNVVSHLLGAYTNKNHSPGSNFVPTVIKFCVMWEGQALPHDTKFRNCRGKIVDSRAFPSWSLIHGSSWSGLIKVGPGLKSQATPRISRLFSLIIKRHKNTVLQLQRLHRWTVWDWISNSIPHFVMDLITYPCWNQS